MTTAEANAAALDGRGVDPVAPADVEAPKKRRLQGAERRERFLDAAAGIVVAIGLSGVTMEEVAARTGVNKRLGYRYFANREALLKALLTRELEESGRRARRVLSAEPDLPERISVNVRIWLDLMRERGPLLSRLLSDQDVVPGLARGANQTATRNWSDHLQRALDLPPASARVLAILYLHALRGAGEALQAGVAPLEEIVHIYTAVALAGVDAVRRGQV